MKNKNKPLMKNKPIKMLENPRAITNPEYARSNTIDNKILTSILEQSIDYTTKNKKEIIKATSHINRRFKLNKYALEISDGDPEIFLKARIIMKDATLIQELKDKSKSAKSEKKSVSLKSVITFEKIQLQRPSQESTTLRGNTLKLLIKEAEKCSQERQAKLQKHERKKAARKILKDIKKESSLEKNSVSLQQTNLTNRLKRADLHEFDELLSQKSFDHQVEVQEGFNNGPIIQLATNRNVLLTTNPISERTGLNRHQPTEKNHDTDKQQHRLHEPILISKDLSSNQFRTVIEQHPLPIVNPKIPNITSQAFFISPFFFIVHFQIMKLHNRIKRAFKKR